ncbi:hypothetical protein AnigIFM49718_011773 [Aspergillus niger]|nr:hypothetical protein AnigIFM49718_011773 [Aspergillus niger]
MPPAASDDLFRQQSRSLGDTSPFPEDPSRATLEHDLGGKTKKKGKTGTKGKNKAAKAIPKSTPDDLLEAEAPSPSPPLQAEPSSCPNPTLEPPPSNNIVSPVLDALGTLGDSPENDIAYRTGTWAKSIPYGKSPPNDAVDGEFNSGSPFGFLTSQDKGGFSHPSSTSPPPGARPLSYGRGYATSSVSRQHSVDRQKSNSVSSPFNNQAPLPHLPQAHFYGAPDIDLPLFSGQNRAATDGSYSFCAFDTIISPSSKASRMGSSVLLVGTDGGLDILAIEDRKTRPVGKLAGLNGRVIEAKLLSNTSTNDTSIHSRPHVAVIIHGPAAQPDDEGHASSNSSEANDIPTGRQSAAGGRPKEETRFYQTRVEVYSLRTGEHITTLLSTPPTPCFGNIPGLPALAPSPAGNLKLFVSGSYVVVASGSSGEVYMYSMSNYQFLGKAWTSIKSKESRRYSTSSSSTDPDGSQSESPHGSLNSDSPIVALKGRWLAIVPPSATYRATLRAAVPTSLLQGKAFGLETRSPPSRPAITCATDVGEGESFFGKVARGVTQELMRGARWMGDQGLQAWNNYWNKEQAQSMPARRSPNLTEFSPQGYNLFPPTHAQDTQSVSTTEPDLVSIFDLRKLEEGEAKSSLFNPVATFQVPNGCSFLSFSPNGLMLFTASKKGDVQYVWDVMQAKYCRAGAFMSDDPASVQPSVRQIARYPRLTTSHIVDVVWCPPSGDKLAVITSKPTVHVFDLPRSAFQWPPFRRSLPKPAKPPTADAPAEELPDRGPAANPLSAAFKMVGGKTQPILAAVRGRTPSTGAAFPSVGGFAMPSAAGVRGGKAVAAGLSKSMGAAATGTVKTVNTIRHGGEHRLHLSNLSRDPVAARVTWIIHKGMPFLGLIDGGYFRLYRIKRSTSPSKSRQVQSVIGNKELEFRLPPHMQTPCGPMTVGPAATTETTVSATLALPSAALRPPPASKLKCQPLSQAEIETNTPYQPFHTDQRVNLFVYSEADDSVGSVPTGQWTFGGSLATTKLHVRPFSASSEEDDDMVHEQHHGFGAEMENLISLGNSTGNVEEVVITTRRKKKQASAMAPGGGVDDGFFEDDCEVLDFARDRV